MKKILVSLLVVLLVLVGCSNGPKDEERTKLVVGVVGQPYKYWDPVIESLKEEGIDLELKVFSEYTIPNRALNDGDIDANAFQHYRFFDEEVKDFNYEISSLGDTILDPLGIYTSAYKSLDEVEDNAVVLIPDDASNGGRALKLLEGAGLIEVDPAKGFLPSDLDITSNPKNLEIKPVKASLIPSLLEDADLAVINGDLAVSFGLKPSSDSIYIEEFDFAANPDQEGLKNLIAVRTADIDKDEYKKLKEAFQSQAVIDVLNGHYNGAFIPAWDK